MLLERALLKKRRVIDVTETLLHPIDHVSLAPPRAAEGFAGFYEAWVRDDHGTHRPHPPKLTE